MQRTALRAAADAEAFGRGRNRESCRTSRCDGDETMKHVRWVEPGRLAVRPGPGCQPWDLGELRAAGFDRIVSLDLKRGVDGAAIQERGMEHLPILLPDDPPNTPARREAYFGAIDRVLAVLDADGAARMQTLIHCYAGLDRSPSVGICYLIARGLDPAQAIRIVTAMTGRFAYQDCKPMIWEWAKRRQSSGPPSSVE
jgi:hypothetical protein